MRAIRILTFTLCLAASLQVCIVAAQNDIASDVGQSPVQTGNAAIYTLFEKPLMSPTTVVTRIRFPVLEEYDALDAIWLAGFSATGAGVPDDLAVGWKKSGWFNNWRLALQTKFAVLPLQLQPETTANGAQYVFLENSMPAEGHVYEATLSYDQSTGYLAVGVVDQTTREDYCRAVVQLKPMHQLLYAGTGLQLAPGGNAAAVSKSFSIENVQTGLTPAGVRWQLLAQGQSGEWLTSNQVDRQTKAAIEVKTLSNFTLPGKLLFFVENGETKKQIAELQPIQGQALLPVDTGRFPPGDGRLTMEYVADQTTRDMGEKRLRVGRVHIALDNLTVDHAKGVLNGAFVLSADGPVPNVQLSSEIALDGTALLPDDAVANATTQVKASLSLASDQQRLPFQLPISAVPAKWRLSLKTQLAAGTGIMVVNDVPTTTSFVSGKDGSDQMVFERLKQQFAAEFLLAAKTTAGIPPLQSNGSWADIDYQEQSVADWKAQAHLNRVRTMAQAFRTSGAAQAGDAGLRQDIVKALGYWVQIKPRNPNWWFNEIWAPQMLGDILLLMGNDIPPDLRTATLNVMRPDIAQLTARGAAGANLVWNESNRIRLGLLENDFDLVISAFAKIAGELRIVKGDEEGIQSDYSFHQHSRQLYSGGYGGTSFAGDISRLAYVTRGTNLFPAEALQTLVDYVLNGQQWMVRRQTFDFSTLGRVISRGEASGNAKYLAQVCQRLSALPNVPRKPELQAFADRLNGMGQAPSANRYFWTSDFMTHQREDYYVSIKAASSRTVATEIGNGENRKGYHLGDGMMFIMQTGAEYDGIFPVWDWERLPGTTTEQQTHTTPEDSWVVVKGGGRVVGAASNGEYGAMGMYLQNGGLSAKKAWFLFDREIVALGAGITAKSQNSVVTSINQTRLTSPVYAANGLEVQTVGQGINTWSNVSWVQHDHIGYVFPTNGSVTIAKQNQTGSWYEINRSKSRQMEVLPVFSLWIDHGLHPDNASYEYIVVPGISPQELEAYVARHDVVTLRNTSELQAVWHAQLHMLQTVFWTPGSVTTPSGLVVSVDQPAVLLVKEQGDTVEITAASLEYAPVRLNVRVASASANSPATQVQFTLPGGDMAGQSLTKQMELPIM